ncbi:MAG TPA: PA2169 family four-helix-bundle protein [Terriglobales bacterium]|nr:PA2169 family four-helix-bundle protein [Terriglobales bacterium]
MADVKRTRDILQNLIETCRDGQKGFREGAENITNPMIREFFNQQSLLRAQFASELESEVRRLGEPDVDTSGSTLAAMHRAWIDLKSSLGGGDEAIVSAAETGEDAAKKAYEEALREPLPGDLREIVQRQAASVIEAHNRVRDFRDSKAA